VNKRASVVSLALAGFLFAFAAPAAAADGKKAEAEVHYEQGKAYYKAGAFDLAIQEFLAGYKLDPRPGVLFNIARGYEELKDKPHAIEYYKKYVDQGAGAAASTEARARMVVLERQIKEDEERKKAEEAERERQRQQALNPPPAMPAPEETKAPAAPPAAPAPTASGSTGPEGAVAVSATPAASPETARTLKIAGIAAGGAGVVLAGVGGFFAWRASSLKSDINADIAKNQYTKDDLAKDGDMKTANTLAVISFIAGGAALAGGAVLYYLGWSQTPQSSGGATAMLSPGVTANSAGLLLTGRF
jgi:tetratricopeptide (TPR) repeat protein